MEHCIKNCNEGQQIAPVQGATEADVVEAVVGVEEAVVGVAEANGAVSGHLLPPSTVPSLVHWYICGPVVSLP